MPQLAAEEVEALRGMAVHIVYRPDLNLPPVEGRLYNVDPSSGTITVFTPEDSGFEVLAVPGHAVASITVYEDQDVHEARTLLGQFETSLSSHGP